MPTTEEALALHDRIWNQLHAFLRREDVDLIRCQRGMTVPWGAPKELPEDLQIFHNARRDMVFEFRRTSDPKGVQHGLTCLNINTNSYDESGTVKLTPKLLKEGAPGAVYGGKSKKRPSLFADYDWDGPWYYPDGDEEVELSREELGGFTWEVDAKRGTHIPDKTSTVFFLYGEPGRNCVMVECTAKGEAIYLAMDEHRCFIRLGVNTIGELMERGLARNFAHQWFLPEESDASKALNAAFAKTVAERPTIRLTVMAVEELDRETSRALRLGDMRLFERVMKLLGRPENEAEPKENAVRIISSLFTNTEWPENSLILFRHICGVGVDASLEQVAAVWNEAGRVRVRVKMEWLRDGHEFQCTAERAFAAIPDFASNPYLAVPPGGAVQQDALPEAQIYRNEPTGAVDELVIHSTVGSSRVLFFPLEHAGTITPGTWDLSIWSEFESYGMY